jgi:hypothetical protein
LSNSAIGAATKALTFIPFAVALYFFDLPNFGIILNSVYLPFFVASCALFALGVFFKRRIIKATFGLSKVSFSWGLLLLGLSAVLYVFGSYSSAVTWFHFESLYFLILGYTAFRIGTRVLRSITPLLVILGLSFAPFGLAPSQSENGIALFLVCIYMVSFFAYTGLRLRPLILAAAMALIGGGVWYLSIALLGVPPYVCVLAIAPLLVLLIPRARGYVLPKRDSPAISCPTHVTLPDGFCSLCSKRVSQGTPRENFGLWGIVALGALTVLLLIASVPALAFVGNVPYQAQFSPRGFSRTALLPTPAGWEVNSTTFYPAFATDTYAIDKVYVPLYHPETKNYTVYYELAAVVLAPNGPGGGEFTGWNRISNTFLPLGPLQGYLTAYTTSGQTMLAYQGRTQLYFSADGTFQAYSLGVGFVRVFKNTNVTSDTSEFVGDIKAVWLPLVATDTSSSNWVRFASEVYDWGTFVTPLVALVASIGAIAWFAGWAMKRDGRVDRFLTLSAGLPGKEWASLSMIMANEEDSRSILSLVQEAKKPPVDAFQVDSCLRELEEKRLVKRILIETPSDIISVWRPVT